MLSGVLKYSSTRLSGKCSFALSNYWSQENLSGVYQDQIVWLKEYAM